MYAVIDLETTGGRADHDRITEIAIILHDGHNRVGEFTSLVNPDRPIPPYITDITGISDAMVATAPRFYEIAREIVELTQNCVFVAHNVNFDYGFLREEFKRLAYQYEREKLCTVRMSRVLMPGLPSYSLGPLCSRLGIPNHARHRAKGDADATVLLLEHLISLQPSLVKMMPKAAKDPFAALPPSLNRKQLSLLPEEAGLYFYHNVQGKAIYVNAAGNIRQAVLKELQQWMKPRAKSPVPVADLCDVTWEQTGNELLALLRVDSEQARHELTVDAAKRRSLGKFAVVAYQDQRGYTRLYVDKRQKSGTGFGEFATEADARAALEARLRRYRLCPQLSGIESGSGACTWHHSLGGSCSGACSAAEPAEDYNRRLLAAVEGLGLPHPAFFLLGEGRTSDEIAVIAIERGELLGYAFLDATQGWEDPDRIKSLLQPLPSTEVERNTLRQYLSKNKLSKLVPF